MNMENAMERIARLLDSQMLAALSSVGNGQPYGSLVTFAAAADYRVLVFVTDRNTTKYRNMQENDSVALLIDNRSNRPEDIRSSVAVTALGTVAEAGDDYAAFKAVFLERHPYLAEFIERSGTGLMAVRVKEYVLAGFSETERVLVDR